LPALRVLVAKELVEKHSLRRVKAAEKMEVTSAGHNPVPKEREGGGR